MSALRRAERILPQTADFRADLCSIRGLDPERIVHFPNFLPDTYFREKHDRQLFSGACVFIGQIKETKGVFDIVRAIADRHGIRCDFYGPVFEKDRKRFMHEMEQSPNCHYRGILARDEVIETLGAYDALLLPTYHEGEGQPAVILEAFAAGVPVVTTRWKSIPELVEDRRRGLLVSPSAPDEIAHALEELSGDRELFTSIARNAHEYVKGFSESAVIGDLLIGMVKEAIGER